MAKTAKMAALGHLDSCDAETELTVKAILIASQRIEQAFLRMPKDARWIWRAALAGIPSRPLTSGPDHVPILTWRCGGVTRASS